MRRSAKAEAVSGEAEVTIERLAHQGDGVALIGGAAVHVPLTAPGDHVRIAYSGTQGRVMERLADGPSRTPPPCRHFGACGGCALQHIAPDAYRTFKMSSLRETLAQRGFDDPPLADLVVIEAAARRRAIFSFRDGAFGFYRASTRDVLDIETCLILRPEIMRAVPRLRAALPQSASGRAHVTLTDAGLDVDLTLDGAPDRGVLTKMANALDLARLTLDGEPIIQSRKPVIQIDGIAVAPPPGPFLQPSEVGQAKLIDWVRDGAGKASNILDLFCGLGTFSLPLARKAKIHAVDSDEGLLRALQEASRHASGLKPVTIEARDLIRNPLPPAQLSRYDAIIFDPPRAGSKLQSQALAKSGVPRIVAVSCSAATFARDARLLCEAGYSLAWIRPLDQFLWSAHIELVALFEKKGRI